MKKGCLLQDLNVLIFPGKQTFHFSSLYPLKEKVKTKFNHQYNAFKGNRVKTFSFFRAYPDGFSYTDDYFLQKSSLYTVMLTYWHC